MAAFGVGLAVRMVDSDQTSAHPGPEISAAISPDSRVIVIAQIVALGGAERSSIALSRWLYHQGIPNHIVTYQDRVGLARAAQHPLRVVQLRPAMHPLPKVLALHRYFHDHPARRHPLMSGYQPALHATLAGLRGFHCLMHDTPSLFTGEDRRSMRGSLLRFASDRIIGHGLRSGGRTIVTSTYLQAECRRTFGVEAVIARMGGLASPESFRPRLAGSTLRLFSVSRVEANKRIDWVIAALAELEHCAEPLSRTADWRLDVAGKGSQIESMRALVRRHGLEQRIRLHGFVSDVELEQLYGAADLFLMPAVQGYGIPAIEALQRGIPVLLHRDSGVSDILLDTPWATVLTGGASCMRSTLAQAIASVREDRHLAAPLPEIPSEDSWSEQVAAVCEWI